MLRAEADAHRTTDQLAEMKVSSRVDSRKKLLVPSRTDTKGSGAPGSFHCPISMELMSDPVMIATGHTYDR